MNTPLGFRLHFGLISMSDGLPVKYGGVGLAVKSSGGMCEYNIAFDKGVYLNGNFSSKYTNFLIKVASELKVEPIPISIKLKYPSHCGFGTGTQICMGIISTLNKNYGLKLSLNHIIKLSGRGGASGIGSYGWDKDGFIFDLGMRQNNSDTRFSSSSNNQGSDQHYFLPTVDCLWSIIVAVPISSVGLYGQKEIEAFSEICPIPPKSSMEAGYEAVFGMYTAAVDANLKLFEESLSRFQGSFWKRKVIEYSPKWLHIEKKHLEHTFDKHFYMSSWGPGLFAFFDCDDIAAEAELHTKIQTYNSTNNKYRLEIVSTY